MRQKGFTLVETLLSIGVVTILFSLVALNIFNSQISTSFTTSVNTFIADLKSQQIKAMAGDTEGRGVPDSYGVYIQSSGYVLFHGQTYSSSDSTNFSIPVGNNLQMSTTFPQSQIIFATGSGEIQNFSSAQNSITIQNPSTNQQKVIQLNKYGSVISVQ